MRIKISIMCFLLFYCQIENRSIQLKGVENIPDTSDIIITVPENNNITVTRKWKKNSYLKIGELNTFNISGQNITISNYIRNKIQLKLSTLFLDNDSLKKIEIKQLNFAYLLDEDFGIFITSSSLIPVLEINTVITTKKRKFEINYLLEKNSETIIRVHPFLLGYLTGWSAVRLIGSPEGNVAAVIVVASSFGFLYFTLHGNITIEESIEKEVDKYAVVLREKIITNLDYSK